MRKVAHCDVCGEEWWPRGGEYPKQCPNRECRSRSWNSGKEYCETDESDLVQSGSGRVHEEIHGPYSTKGLPELGESGVYGKKHDVKNCRVYGCLMCKAIKSG